MHHAGDAVRVPVFGDEGEEVSFGVGWAVLFFGGGRGEFAGAAVDQDGFAGGRSDLHLGDEGGLLGWDAGIFKVVVVEADLAEGDALFLRDERCESGEIFGGGLMGFLWMDTGAGVDIRMRVRDTEGAVHGVGAVANADG